MTSGLTAGGSRSKFQKIMFVDCRYVDSRWIWMTSWSFGAEGIRSCRQRRSYTQDISGVERSKLLALLLMILILTKFVHVSNYGGRINIDYVIFSTLLRPSDYSVDVRLRQRISSHTIGQYLQAIVNFCTDRMDSSDDVWVCCIVMMHGFNLNWF